MIKRDGSWPTEPIEAKLIIPILTECTHPVRLLERNMSCLYLFHCNTVAVIAKIITLTLHFVPTERLSALSRRPNILFLLADDLGYGDVRYNGGLADTPNLDAMARGTNSVQFSRFYSGSPVCSPTRGTVLTGRNHNRYCVWRSNTHGNDCNWISDFHCPAKVPLPPSEITVAEILQNIGYHTAAIGKWHLGDLKHLENGHSLWSPSHPGMHGFDVWKVTERAVPTVNPNCACFDAETCRLGHYSGQSLPPCSNYHGNNASEAYLPSSSASGAVSSGTASSPSPSCPIFAHPEPIVGDDSSFIVNELSAFVNESVANQQPFFAYVAFHTPHNRYIALPEYAEKYQKLGWRRKQKDYFGSIEALDHAIGEVLRHLDYLNITNNTMIWFASDNGPAAKSPGSTQGLRGEKGTLYEGGIRVPGILQWPDAIKQNRQTDYPVSTSDFLPTVLDVTNTELPDSRTLDGISILPFLVEQQNTRTEPINWAFKILGNFSEQFRAASLKDDLKLHILYKDGRMHQSWLYNITEGETRNLAGALPRQHRQMVRDLNSWTKSLASSAQDEVRCLHSAGYFEP